MKNTNLEADDFKLIVSIVEKYFDGLYQGDVTLLSSIFHHDVWLKAPDSRRSLSQWLADVANRPIPAQQNAVYGFTILSVDIVQDQAMVKIRCPLFNFSYIDFLGLLKEQGQWLIVSKMYTDVKHLNGGF